MCVVVVIVDRRFCVFVVVGIKEIIGVGVMLVLSC